MAWTTAVTRATSYGVTAAVWNSEHVDNMNFLKEVAYSEFTSDYSTTATSEATATQIVTAGALTYEAVPHEIEFFAPAGQGPANDVLFRFALFDGTTIVGNLGTVEGSSTSMRVPIGKLSTRLTPTAASHTYNVKGWVGSGTGTLFAGNGGTDNELPGFMRITRIPT